MIIIILYLQPSEKDVLELVEVLVGLTDLLDLFLVVTHYALEELGVLLAMQVLLTVSQGLPEPIFQQVVVTLYLLGEHLSLGHHRHLVYLQVLGVQTHLRPGGPELLLLRTEGVQVLLLAHHGPLYLHVVILHSLRLVELSFVHLHLEGRTRGGLETLLQLVYHVVSSGGLDSGRLDSGGQSVDDVGVFE